MNVGVRHSLLRLLMSVTRSVLLVMLSQLYFKLRPSSPTGWQKTLVFPFRNVVERLLLQGVVSPCSCSAASGILVYRL